jgi:hypothetical protein
MNAGPLVALPREYWDVPYDGARYPGAVARGELQRGANCQMWAYEVLDYFGFAVPDLRSDELWRDEVATQRISDSPKALDLVLYSVDHDAYGAHVGVWTGTAIAHLCQEVGRPTVWAQADCDARARYAVRIGFKRPILRTHQERVTRSMSRESA